ncbi:poly(A) RNA polymerase, mitochondrial-like [Liolophura sinensis]|uniref:poly(A) RNA polymerase, mitochondrial-like n=1 Tax=Liolophura sinensis TaxID=3198878 RepID=UPI0031582E46
MAAPMAQVGHMMCSKTLRCFRRFSSGKGVKRKIQKSSSKVQRPIDEIIQNITSPRPVSFQQMYHLRRQEAHRSILVQIPSKKHISSVYNQVKPLGKVMNIFHFSHIRDYALIELESRAAVQRVLRSASHFSNDEKIPVESRVLLLTGGFESVGKQTIPLPVQSDPKEKFEISDCYNATGLSHQIEILYHRNHLTDLGCRLRFFVCSKLEDMLSGLFPHCAVLPFGSTVNGFGKHDCDLDMTLSLLQSEHQVGKNPNLKFMTKKRTDNERGFTQRSLQTVADIIEQFVPLCLGVHRILNARVPIIKFRNDACNIECDLSFSHISGHRMSEVLWVLSELDPRVAPLVFCVRHWARVNEVNRKHPGPWVSNFMLTALVVFFLQSHPQPVIPKLRTLYHPVNPHDDFSAPFMSDYTKVPKTKNTDDLGELLKGFFAFYSSFDFQSRGMSVIEGTTFSKPDFSPVYLENPLDVNLNVCKNINIPEFERLKKAFETALWNLETNGEKKQRAWGLMSILLPNGNGNNGKLHVHVGDLFSQRSESGNQDGNQDGNVDDHQVDNQGGNQDGNQDNVSDMRTKAEPSH